MGSTDALRRHTFLLWKQLFEGREEASEIVPREHFLKVFFNKGTPLSS
jgi:hypothetical protein